MSHEQDRLDALEEFAGVIAAAMNIPWLDQQIVNEIAKAGEGPDRREIFMRTALLLGDGRERLVKQIKNSPPTTTSPTQSTIN